MPNRALPQAPSTRLDDQRLCRLIEPVGIAAQYQAANRDIGSAPPTNSLLM